MIKGLTGVDGIIVSGGNTSVPYIPQNTETPMQGMIRIWGSDMQVFTGTSWKKLSTSYATASLSQDVLDIIAWARKAMEEEKALEKLANNHPAVDIALTNMQRAREQLKATIILSKEHDTTS